MWLQGWSEVGFTLGPYDFGQSGLWIRGCASERGLRPSSGEGFLLHTSASHRTWNDSNNARNLCIPASWSIGLRGVAVEKNS